MSETVFINDFITIGIDDYFGRRTSNFFEAHIIECLCDIYGEEALKNVCQNRDEAGFINLIHKYGLSRNMYDNFMRDMLRYEKFMSENKSDPSIKSDIASKIEVSIITMFLYKCLLIEPSLEDISHFENDLLNNFAIIKHHFNTSLNPNRTREVWDKKKHMLTDNVELVEIKPEYLDEFTYAKFGTSLQDVKKMDYRMVDELNKYIKSKQAIVVEEIPKRRETKGDLFKNTILSTGNGYVDALLIAAIIATEISLGLIYLFLHIGG